jgi:hypothetical protein
MNRRTIVAFRVTRHERAALVKIAGTMTLSDWLRARVFEGITVYRAEGDERQLGLPLERDRVVPEATRPVVKVKRAEKGPNRKGAPKRH